MKVWEQVDRLFSNSPFKLNNQPGVIMKIGDQEIRGHVSSAFGSHHNRHKDIVTCDRYGHIVEESAEDPIDPKLQKDRELNFFQPEQIKAEEFN